jgi:hypothetical protein
MRLDVAFMARAAVELPAMPVGSLAHQEEKGSNPPSKASGERREALPASS